MFDPEIYSTNYERGLSNRKSSSLRNFEGNGDILAHPVCSAAEKSSVRDKVPEKDAWEASAESDVRPHGQEETSDRELSPAPEVLLDASESAM